jgi:hypothetical protein
VGEAGRKGIAVQEMACVKCSLLPSLHPSLSLSFLPSFALKAILEKNSGSPSEKVFRATSQRCSA